MINQIPGSGMGGEDGGGTSSGGASSGSNARRLMPLHSLLSAVQNHEESRAQEATQQEISALPRRILRKTDKIENEDNSMTGKINRIVKHDIKKNET